MQASGKPIIRYTNDEIVKNYKKDVSPIRLWRPTQHCCHSPVVSLETSNAPNPAMVELRKKMTKCFNKLTASTVDVFLMNIQLLKLYDEELPELVERFINSCLQSVST